MKWVLDILSSLLVAIMPPHTLEDIHVYRWRQTIAFVIFGLIASFLGHIAIECGLVPGWDSGFARASEIKTLGVQQERQADLILQGQINMSMEKWCAAQAIPLAKRYQREQLSALLQEYANEHDGRVFSLPTCEQLGFK